MIYKLAIVFLAVAATSAAHARVFNFKEATLGAYVRGTGGKSAVGQDPFGNSSGGDTIISEETNWDYSGELGAQLSLGDKVNLRLGVEAIQHRPVTEAKGTNQSGAERFTLDSDVFIFNPNATLEYIYHANGHWRFYALAGAGLADVTVVNSYKMTALGTADYGVGDFDEKMHASVYSGHVGTGFEALFTDNATVSMDLNYRYLKVQTIKYKGDTQSIVAPGGVTKGETAYNQDGNKRTLDLGGVYVGVTFRFYLNFL